MRRRNAVSNSPASALRRFGSSTVARFVLIGFVFFPVSCHSEPGAKPGEESASCPTLQASCPATPHAPELTNFVSLEPVACLPPHRVPAAYGISKRLATRGARVDEPKTLYLAGFS